MIKGCERRIIYIRDTGSAVFKEAYFVLRDGAPSVPEQSMVAEAERIIRERTQPHSFEKKKSPTPDRKNFIAGFLVAAGVFSAGIIVLALVL